MGEPQQPTGWVTADQAQQMVEAALAQHAANQPVQPQGTITADAVQSIVDEALGRQAAAHNDQLQQLMASLRGNVVTYVPAHAGGPGTEISDTWSQWEQSLAIAADDLARQAK